jgi:hypothetical protein
MESSVVGHQHDHGDIRLRAADLGARHLPSHCPAAGSR